MKKGSLSLSVNAIVIFVLAFAMLGFGLFVINMLQDEVGKVVPGILDRDSWDPVPSSQDRIVIKGTLNFEAGTTNVVGLGYYNLAAEPKTVGPSTYLTCKPELGSTETTGIFIDTLEQTIPARDWAPFKMTVRVGSAVEGDKTYICNIPVSDGTDTVTLQESIVVE